MPTPSKTEALVLRIHSEQDRAAFEALDAATAQAQALQYREAAFELTSLQRANARKSLVRLGWSVASTDMLIEKKALGRPKVAATDGDLSKWAALGAPLIAALGGEVELPSDPAAWVADKCRAIAGMIVDYYDNPHSRSFALNKFHASLRSIGVEPDVADAALRPDVTAEHNRLSAVAQSERIASGIGLPAEYKSLEAVRERVRRFIASDEKPTGQTAADFLVCLAARPGEAETLDIGPGGGLVGALKKKPVPGKEAPEFPIVSLLATADAVALVQKWRNTPVADRRTATMDLVRLTSGWGIQRRDLRAIGAQLAVLTAEPATAAEGRVIAEKALRHATSRPAAVDYYMRVKTEDLNDVKTHLERLEPSHGAMHGGADVLESVAEESNEDVDEEPLEHPAVDLASTIKQARPPLVAPVLDPDSAANAALAQVKFLGSVMIEMQAATKVTNESLLAIANAVHQIAGRIAVIDIERDAALRHLSRTLASVGK
jgi:hypothetical protein